MECFSLGFWRYAHHRPRRVGEPANRDNALAVLRRAVELGVDFIDTADSYAPTSPKSSFVKPFTRTVTFEWRRRPDSFERVPACGIPAVGPCTCGQQCELSLRRLGVESLDLFQLHRIDSEVNADDQFGVLRELLDEGKVRAVGLSEVSTADIERARQIVDIVSVQNLYNLTARQSEEVLNYCERREGIAFIPWYPVASGELARAGGPLDTIASEVGASVATLSLAWLLKRSDVHGADPRHVSGLAPGGELLRSVA
jgi:aryl-alcohol dehydrogenase-like predicted oxidoreductase